VDVLYLQATFNGTDEQGDMICLQLFMMCGSVKGSRDTFVYVDSDKGS